MLSVESDTECGVQFPLCDNTDLGDLGRESFVQCGIADERREDIAVLTSQDGIAGDTSTSIHSKRTQYESKSRMPRLHKLCRWRQGAVLLLGVFLTVVALTLVVVGGIRSRQHTGIKLLHIQSPVDLKSILYLGDENFTFAQLMSLTNVALDRSASQSTSFSPEAEEGLENARTAVDGNLSTCSITGLERKPQWQVDLLGSRYIKSVRIHGSSTFKLRNLVISISPEANATNPGSLCGKMKGPPKGNYVRIECGGTKTRGRYVTIEMVNPKNSYQALCLCEVMVYAVHL